MSDENVIAPASPFQYKYLTSNAQIILVGGAAGSSKSYIGLMRHLRFAEDPNYRGYCIRKNSAAIMKSGGLFWEAVALYRRYDPNLKVKLKDQKVVFSSGAEVSFSHYENTNAGQNYQGIQISNGFYDECTHAEEEHIWWLWSRLRSTAKNVHSLWLSCNPDVDSWVLKYALWYLYPEGHPLAGRPDPSKNGTIRYLLRINGDVVWGDTYEELQEKYGYDKVPISFQGIFGTILDNPPLQASNPLYKSNLEALPRIEKERLLYGNWFARAQNSTYFSRDTVVELDTLPSMQDVVKLVRAYDFASTLPHDTNRSPDYFASVKMAKMKTGEFVILEVERTRITAGKWEPHILANAARDGSKCTIVLPQDVGVLAKDNAKQMANRITQQGFPCVTKASTMGKLEAFRPFAATAEIGFVHVVKHCAVDHWNKIEGDNDFFYKELEAFNGLRRSGESGHDDMVDCCSLAYLYLASKISIGNSFLHGVKATQTTNNNPLLSIR